MIEYLQGRNRDVNFTGAVDEDAIQEAIDEAVRTYNDNAENSSIYGKGDPNSTAALSSTKIRVTVPALGAGI